jgi:hypothetical protein
MRTVRYYHVGILHMKLMKLDNNEGIIYEHDHEW